MTTYLTADQIIRINTAEIGDDLLIDYGKVDAAAQRPQTTVGGEDAYPTLHEKAAALFHSLIKNHAFLDGNKRTAVLALVIFYRMNGYQAATDEGALVGIAVDVAESQLDVASLAAELKTMFITELPE